MAVTILMMQRVLNAFMAKDPQAFASAFAPDGVFFDPHYTPPQMHGQEQIFGAVQRAFLALERPGYRVQNGWEGDKNGVLEVEADHLLKSGMTIRYPQVFVFEFEGGLIKRLQTYLPFSAARPAEKTANADAENQNNQPEQNEDNSDSQNQPEPLGVRPVIHIVQTGESLWGISGAYLPEGKDETETPQMVIAIQHANPEIGDGRQLFPNQRLVIPVERLDFRGRDGLILKDGQRLKDMLADKYSECDPNYIARYSGYESAGHMQPGDPFLVP
jgi:ketosteroid isomerase-like protein